MYQSLPRLPSKAKHVDGVKSFISVQVDKETSKTNHVNPSQSRNRHVKQSPRKLPDIGRRSDPGTSDVSSRGKVNPTPRKGNSPPSSTVRPPKTSTAVVDRVQRNRITDNNTFQEYYYQSVSGYSKGKIKTNQDAVMIYVDSPLGPNASLLAVFDGHGTSGHRISDFLRQHISGRLGMNRAGNTGDRSLKGLSTRGVHIHHGEDMFKPPEQIINSEGHQLHLFW